MATLDDCVLEVRQRTDTVGSSHVTDAEIRTLLNKRLARLHGKLTCAYEDYSVTTATATVTLASAKGFSLPADFFKLLRVDKSLSSSATAADWIRLRRVNIRDESNYNQALLRSAAYPRVFGYVMYGSEIHLIPQSQVVGVYQYLYYPQWTVLTGSGTVSLGPAGQQWEELAILGACIDVANKEETDPSGFMAEHAKLDDELEGIIANRDAGEAEPPTATDVPWYERSGGGSTGYFGWGY